MVTGKTTGCIPAPISRDNPRQPASPETGCAYSAHAGCTNFRAIHKAVNISDYKVKLVQGLSICNHRVSRAGQIEAFQLFRSKYPLRI